MGRRLKHSVLYTRCSVTLHYTALHYITLHYTTLHYTTLHYTTLHYTTLHYTSLNYTTLHSDFPTLHLKILSYTLQYNTLTGLHTAPNGAQAQYCTSSWTVGQLDLLQCLQNIETQYKFSLLATLFNPNRNCKIDFACFLHIM